MAITLYGISNCDTVKKARKWLDTNSVIYAFHDFRKDGIDTGMVDSFLDQVGEEMLINKRGLSWRKLSEKQKQLDSRKNTIKLLIATPTLIKRPVLDINGNYTIGFSEELYKGLDFD
ncbi:MAG: ArsC family reductase [Gammaproteobacteria bacterium]